MNPNLSAREKQNGQALVELVVAIALFAILAQALFTLVTSSYRLISFTSARITARHLAQEKIELIRNLPYEDVGTVSGVPDGPIFQEENVFRNGLNYVVSTDIVYIDDPLDGIAPTDLLPTDFKRVRVDVSWGGLASSNKSPVSLITDIAPRGVESTVGGGTLSVLVFDANAQPVSQAEVTIYAPSISPPVDLTLLTDSSGRVILPGALPCTDCYQITTTKEGYSTDKTYSTSEVANPDKPHATIIESKLTEISFAIDLVSTLEITTTNNRDSDFSPLGNITFNIRGDKTIGTDALDELVYKYEETLSTNASGEIVIEDLEWDNYSITIPAITGYDVSGFNPLLPVNLLPNSEFEQKIALNSNSANSFLVTFTDPGDLQIASVSARLFDGGTYEASASSGIIQNPDFGQIFFSDLSDKIYYLEATASGYNYYTDSVEISGDIQEQAFLDPI
ncbi:prepilin-type N-terminal cleavage/methylation domain-containing protein [Candidatus Woesebacteria bacterium]|nr:prepilin-type N-terminal cleavage/methylation domain-containing protein [Candidatus Woesebacteria bacterium]